MKSRNLLLGLTVALAAMSAWALQDLPITSTQRVGAQTVVGVDQTSRDHPNGPIDLGIIVYAKVTATSGATGTLTFYIDGKNQQGDYVNVLTSTAVNATGTTVLTVRPGITAASNVSAAYPLPPVFRVRAVQAGGTTTFSVSTSRTN